jgi:hypothetical protein
MIQEEARLRWQSEREDADKKDRAERERDLRQFQADQAELADKRHKESLIAAEQRDDKKHKGDWKRTIATLAVGGAISCGAVAIRELLHKAPIINVLPATPNTAPALQQTNPQTSRPAP